MEPKIGIRELKNGTSAIIDRVERGEPVTVTRHGKPVARILPANLPEGIARLAAEGRIELPEGRLELPRKRIKLRGKGKTAAEYVSEGRR